MDYLDYHCWLARDILHDMGIPMGQRRFQVKYFNLKSGGWEMGFDYWLAKAQEALAKL